MVRGFLRGAGSVQGSWLVSGVVTCACLVVAMAVSGGGSRAYTAYSLAVHKTEAIPAFARKYGLRCSACHTVWPELSAFGQKFKDNGYQLGNDRDSPIWQNNAYWPIAMRTTPQLHLESTTHQVTDAAPGGKTVSQAGFDLSGVDFLLLGTLYKNITFGLVPTLDADGTTGLEAAFVRFDNLGSSPWANLKVGKFELDNLLSEKRITWLSANGGFLYAYHYLPVGSTNNFGFGDNQIGAEFSGHSINSYTRYSVSLLSTDDGQPGLPGGKSLDAMFTLSQAWALGGGLGPQRLGVFGYVGHRPTAIETVNGGVDTIPGTGSANKSFFRIGATAQLWLGNLELIPLVSHASDDAALGPGTDKPTWNSALLEAHYVVNPQFLVQGRYELLRMSQQGDPAIPKTQGNADAIALGVRVYPFMFSRAGMAIHGEFAMTKTIGTVPLSGDGSGVDPVTPGTSVWSRSVMLGFDFAF
ncbi:MAG TPA: hypothetical protein VK647_12105 [Gemmatimonadales bacterium]|nr:hypothetical protein [Gemmatimonadales bacterium]